MSSQPALTTSEGLKPILRKAAMVVKPRFLSSTKRKTVPLGDLIKEYWGNLIGAPVSYLSKSDLFIFMILLTSKREAKAALDKNGRLTPFCKSQTPGSPSTCKSEPSG